MNNISFYYKHSALEKRSPDEKLMNLHDCFHPIAETVTAQILDL